MKRELKRKSFAINLTTASRFRSHVGNLFFIRRKIKKFIVLIFRFFFHFCFRFCFWFFFFHFHIESEIEIERIVITVEKFEYRRQRTTKTSKTHRKKIKFTFAFIIYFIEHIEIANEISQKANVTTIFARRTITANSANSRFATKKNKKTIEKSKNATSSSLFWKKLMLIIEWKFIHEFFRRNRI